jgi:hypothetical protein
VNDLAQRQQALDISQSFIIQAPAGSGKKNHIMLLQNHNYLQGYLIFY